MVNEEQESAVYIDGSRYVFDDLTFEEEAQYRRLMRELAPPKPCRACDGKGVITITGPDVAPAVEVCPRCAGEGELDESHESDYVVAFIAVIQRRANPDYSLEDAKHYRRSDVQRPPTQAKGKAAARR